MKWFSCLLLISAIIFSVPDAFAEREQRVNVGQGISAPISRTSVNFSNGFTYANSAVAASIAKPAFTLQADTGDDSSGNNNTGYGGELSVGTGQAGVALGYYERDCDNCEGRFGGIAGVAVSSFALGLGFREEDQFSAGLLVNQKGRHRFGFTVDMLSSDLPDNDIMSFGGGYSYHGQGFVFALDASKRETESTSDDDGLVLVTPGLEVHADKWGLSVSYDMGVNDGTNPYDDNVWFGVGYRGQNFEISAYHDYVNEWSMALSFIF